MRRIPFRQDLFALEQSLRSARAPAPRPAPPASKAKPPVKSRAFDSGAPIDLRYDASYHAATGAAPPRPAVAFSAELRDGSMAYFVEPFEGDPAPERPTPPPPRAAPAAPTSEAAAWSPPADEPDATAEQMAMDEDLRAILGEAFRVAEGLPREAPAPAPQPRREPEPPPPPAPPAEDPHRVFDRLGESLAFATTFNLPAVDLEHRFSEFDQRMDRNARAARPAPAPLPPVPVYVPVAAQPPAAAMSLDHETLARDLALLTGDAPSARAAAQAVAPAYVVPVAQQPIPQPAPAAPRPMAMSGDQSFEVRYDVPLIPQQTDMSCWAAGAAMLLAWRDRASVDPGAIGRAVGYVKEYAQGLAPDDTRVFAAWGLTPEPAQTYTVDGFRRLLERHGPLWVAGWMPGAHIRVVTGVHGDGTPDGTHVHINDPWEAGMTGFRLPNAGAQYTESYRVFEASQRQLAAREQHLNGIYVVHL